MGSFLPGWTSTRSFRRPRDCVLCGGARQTTWFILLEASVSGSGLHVIVKAHPLSAGIAHGGVEMYTKGRFFTMTGRAPEDARIVAAPDEFAALAEELRAQSTSSRTGEGDPSPRDGEQTADAEANAWFGKLPPEKQSEVVKYAALHIAKNSKLFELTENGGNYQDYLKLTLAIARSGVPDAENIFVEAASIAKDADPDEMLRKFFQNCEHAQPSNDSVTVGTLFYVASQCGADFSQWKQIADISDPDVALFVPGNEDECRKLIDRVVAADPRTFTLGDPTGPLVILRVPDKEALPPGTRWEGDLPGTTLATPADIMQRAERLVWKQRAGGKAKVVLFVPIHRAHSSPTISFRCVANTEHRLCGASCECRGSTTTAKFISFRATTPKLGFFTIDHPFSRSRRTRRVMMPEKWRKCCYSPFQSTSSTILLRGEHLSLLQFSPRSSDHFCPLRRCSSYVVRCQPRARARSCAASLAWPLTPYPSSSPGAVAAKSSRNVLPPSCYRRRRRS